MQILKPKQTHECVCARAHTSVYKNGTGRKITEKYIR